MCCIVLLVFSIILRGMGECRLCCVQGCAHKPEQWTWSECEGRNDWFQYPRSIYFPAQADAGEMHSELVAATGELEKARLAVLRYVLLVSADPYPNTLN